MCLWKGVKGNDLMMEVDIMIALGARAGKR